MNRKKQYALYIIFAVLSTILNAGIQKGVDLVFTGGISWGLYHTAIHERFDTITYGYCMQVLSATLLAFVFKYFADKLVIFKDTTAVVSAKHMFQVILYTSFAVITTLIFWGTETAFKLFVNIPQSQYIGLVIGLGIGYTIKYLLDRKYVFN